MGPGGPGRGGPPGQSAEDREKERKRRQEEQKRKLEAGPQRIGRKKKKQGVDNSHKLPQSKLAIFLTNLQSFQTPNAVSAYCARKESKIIFLWSKSSSKIKKDSSPRTRRRKRNDLWSMKFEACLSKLLTQRRSLMTNTQSWLLKTAQSTMFLCSASLTRINSNQVAQFC